MRLRYGSISPTATLVALLVFINLDCDVADVQPVDPAPTLQLSWVQGFGKTGEAQVGARSVEASARSVEASGRGVDANCDGVATCWPGVGVSRGGVGAPITRSVISKADNPVASLVHVDDVRRTRDFYFRIDNLGTRDVTDVVIKMETDRTGVEVYPSRFERIKPIDQALAPTFLRVHVEHGPLPHEYRIKTEVNAPTIVIGKSDSKSAEATAARVIQEPGLLSATLMAEGRLDGGASVQAELLVTSDIQLTDVIFLDNRGELDLTDPYEIYLTGRARVPDFVPVFRKFGAVFAVNVGTVPADLRYIAKQLQRSFTVAPGDTVQVIESIQSGWIRVSPERATVNYNRFPRMSDGYSYVYFSRGG